MSKQIPKKEKKGLRTYLHKIAVWSHTSTLYSRFKQFSKHYFGGLYYRSDEHHIFLLAGGLAFSLFICIIPFVLIIFAVLGSVLDSQNMQYQINLMIDTMIPYYQYSEFVKKIIFSRITEVIEYKNVAGIIGGFGLLFAASGLFSSMRTVLNTVFNITYDVHFLIGKLRDFALVLMVLIIFFVTTVTIPFLDVLRRSAGQIKALSVFNTGIFEHFLFSFLSLILVFILFFILYLTVPLRKLGRRANVVSSLWAAILWETAKQLFGYYIYNFASFGKIYGTYALVVVVAFWIYYSSVVFIVGAEIGRLYYERRMVKGQTISDTGRINLPV